MTSRAGWVCGSGRWISDPLAGGCAPVTACSLSRPGPRSASDDALADLKGPFEIPRGVSVIDHQAWLSIAH